jgi:demethylmenaquinone methyltransferase/2-methoxy-6-polyprenyl-1,4-benzoquinol methylase
MQPVNYDEAYVRDLFDRMGPTYDIVNYVSSFGFCEWWRMECVRNAKITAGQRVCDMMAGSGESWRHITNRGATVISVDFSRVMVERQRKRQRQFGSQVEVYCENALHTSIAAESMDALVAAFGLKTLNAEALAGFAREISRILKPSGHFSLLEISTADGWWLAPAYKWYIDTLIPLLGKLCLANIECYRMLGVYTSAFGSCERIVPIFRSAGLNVAVKSHFFGCATSLVGTKESVPGQKTSGA